MTRRTEHADPRDLARRIAARKLGFFIHCAVFVLVNLGLVAVNALTGRGAWSVFPLLGWGLGLLVHGAVALGPVHRLYGRMVEREVERIGRRP